MAASRGTARGERAGLVEKQGRASGQAFEDTSPFDHDTAASRSGKPRDEGDRSGQDEGTWRRDHEHRHRSRRARRTPGRSGRGQAHEQEPERIAVGQANKRSR